MGKNEKVQTERVIPVFCYIRLSRSVSVLSSSAMKGALCLLFALVAIAAAAPPSAPVVGNNWSFMGISEAYNKVNGSVHMNTGWYYGDSAKQRTGIILVGRDYHIGILDDSVTNTVLVADYNTLQCSSFNQKSTFVGPNFYAKFKYIGTMKKAKAPMCGDVDGFEQIVNNTVEQSWFVKGTNIPCFAHYETNEYMELFWYVDFIYNTPFG